LPEGVSRAWQESRLTPAKNVTITRASRGHSPCRLSDAQLPARAGSPANVHHRQASLARHGSSVAGGGRGDHRPSAWDHPTDRRKWRQPFVRRARYRSRFRSSRWIADANAAAHAPVCSNSRPPRAEQATPTWEDPPLEQLCPPADSGAHVRRAAKTADHVPTGSQINHPPNENRPGDRLACRAA
jgi:hypothetical protein